MFKPMPSPKGSNHEGLFVPAKFVPSPTMAFDAAPTGLTRKPATSTTPSASPKPTAPRKPAVDGPSRQDSLRALMDFLSANLPANLFAQVEAELMERFAEEPEPSPQAADRRPKIAGDSAGMAGFFERFPAAKKIGAA